MALRLRRLFPSMLSRFPNMIQYRTVLNFTGCSLPYSASSKGGGYYGKLIQFGLRTVRDSYVSPVGGCGHRIFVHFPAKLGAGNNLGFHLQPREIVQRRLFSSKVGTYPHFEEGSSGVVGTQKSGSLKKKRRYGARKKGGADRGRSVIQNAVSAEPKVISQESKKGGEIIFQTGKEVADKGASEKNQHVAALVDCFTGVKSLTGYNVLSSTVKIRKSDPSWRLRSAAARKRGAAKMRKLTIRNVDSKKGGEIIFQPDKEVADKGASEKTQHVTALVDCFTGAKPVTGDSFLSSTVKKQKSDPSRRLRLVAARKRGAAKMRKLTIRNVDSTDPKGRGGQELKSGCDVVCGSGGTRLAMSKGKNAQTTKASLEQFVEAQPDIRKMDSAHIKKHEGREVKSGDQLSKIKNKKTRPAKRSIKKKRLSTGKEVEGKPSSGTTSSVTAEIEDSTTASRSSGPCTTSASSVKVKTNKKRLKARGKALASHKMDAAITSKSVSKNIKVQKDENRGEIISHSGKMATTNSKDMKTQIAKDSDTRNQSLKSKKQKKKNFRKSMSLVTAETKGSGTASQAKKPHTSNALLQRNEIRRPVLPVEGGTKDMKKKLMPLYPPLGKSVVVVESLTKAQLIQGYLGDMFEVLPSYGHVRDLAARSGSVRPDDDFSMVWEVPSSAWTPLKSIMVALNGAENLILASDPDREGEAIAWHITEMLRHQDSLLDNITVARVVFHEITETSIKNALMNPRDIDANLVNAHLARRALEYLIGFKISPLLWQKLPGCQMAGRVQSVALALVCEREMEIDRFKPEEYWTVNVEFQKEAVSSIKENPFSSKLMHLNPKKLEKLSIGSSAEVEAVKQRISLSEFRVIDTCTNQSKSCPPLPYITSTLQQDAGSILHFTVAQTMSLAQKLYEGVKLSENEATGLITYMRTDRPHVSKEAAHDILSFVSERYGMQYALKCPRTDFQKVTNSQESYEAIRPTNIRRLPSMLVGVLDNDCLKLYTLIWSRTMASQMESSITDMVQVDIGNLAGDIVFQSTSSKIGFLGHQAVSKDEETALIAADFSEGDSCEEAYSVLPSLRVNDQVYLGKVELMQHSTEPPVRYSEGSLVKKLEELGIGRPSTYASVIKVLQVICKCV
ncbi:hypothetical protein QJS10_CPA05g02062 [Acorus calamus]|uniref:DNA topoisomerase n=1 Tax=Acorus calamus TaxID=4465 RepID=A0AAV9EV32_ACOCL|nr:hypothetical protein QJS10_CPA05g02062 [Acorus calamus]